jgi:hypothetical protein
MISVSGRGGFILVRGFGRVEVKLSLWKSSLVGSCSKINTRIAASRL